MPSHRLGAVLRPAYRVTTFVPPEHLEAVLEAVEAIYPLLFGPYDRSAWWSSSTTEQFRPLEGSRPSVGAIGQVHQVATVRLEFALPLDEELLARVLDEGLLPAHPWQEPAVFVDQTLVTATRLEPSADPA